MEVDARELALCLPWLYGGLGEKEIFIVAFNGVSVESSDDLLKC